MTDRLSLVVRLVSGIAACLPCTGCSESDSATDVGRSSIDPAATVAADHPGSATPPSPPASGPWFVAAGPESGLDFRNVAGPTAAAGKRYLLDCIGQGLATLDFDGDGDLDLYFAQGRADSLPLADVGGSGGDSANRLYRNLGDRRFEECGQEAGVADPGYGFGALAFDYDNDGDPDLLVTNFGPNHLFRNEGGRFVDVTDDHPGLAGRPRDWTTGAAAADVDRDGDLDLYLCNYVRHDGDELDAQGLCRYMTECVVPCGPSGLDPQADVFFLNDGPPDYRFREATAASGFTATPSYGFQPVFTDVENDGDLDLYVSNDSVPNFLFVNDGRGRFAEVGLLSGAATGNAGQSEAGMGVAAGDLDGDALPEIYVTNFSTQHNSLYYNLSSAAGMAFFEERSVTTGVGHPTFFKLSWGCALVDFDDDGWPDIFVANSHVYPQVDDCPPAEIVYRQPLSFFRRQPGEALRFTDLGPVAGEVLGREGSYRGSAAADLDEDGDLDLVLSALDVPPLLLWNETAAPGHRLTLTLLAGDSPAVGALVVAQAGSRRWTAETRAGSSFLCTEDPRVHLGLGEHAVLDSLTVRFPDGTVWEDRNVAADRHLLIRAGREGAEELPAAGGDR